MWLDLVHIYPPSAYKMLCGARKKRFLQRHRVNPTSKLLPTLIQAILTLSNFPGWPDTVVCS